MLDFIPTLMKAATRSWKTLSETARFILWLAAIAVVVLIILLNSTAFSQTSTINAACPQQHITDFIKASQSNKELTFTRRDGAEAADFYKAHVEATQPPKEFRDLPVAYAMVVEMDPAKKPAKGLVVYFDGKGCYILHTPIDMLLLKHIKTQIWKVRA